MESDLVRIFIPKEIKVSQSTKAIFIVAELRGFLVSIFTILICLVVGGVFLRIQYQSDIMGIRDEIDSYKGRILTLEFEVSRLGELKEGLVSKYSNEQGATDVDSIAISRRKKRNSYSNRESYPGYSESRTVQRSRTVQTKNYRNNEYETEDDGSEEEEAEIIPDSNINSYVRLSQSGSGSRARGVTFPPIPIQNGHYSKSSSQSKRNVETEEYDNDEVLDLGTGRHNRNEPDISRIMQIPSGTLRTSGLVLRGGNFIGIPCNATKLPKPCALSGPGSASGGVSGYNYTYRREYSEGIPGARNYTWESTVPIRGDSGSSVMGQTKESGFEETIRQSETTSQSEITRQRQEDAQRRLIEIRRQQQLAREEENNQRLEQIRQEELRQEQIRRTEEIRHQEREQQERQDEIQRQDTAQELLRLAEIQRQDTARQDEIQRQETARRRLQMERAEEETRRQIQLRQIEISRTEEESRRKIQRQVYTTRKPMVEIQTQRNNNYHQSESLRREESQYAQRQRHGYDDRQATPTSSCRGANPLAAHFTAEKSEDNYNNVYETFTGWRAAEWMTNERFSESNVNNFVLSSTGQVTIRKAGLYYVYAQIYFEEESLLTSFTVELNSVPFLHCTNMNNIHALGGGDESKMNSCFTAGLRFINANDQLLLKDNSGRRYSVFDPEKSFFGIMNIGGSCQ